MTEFQFNTSLLIKFLRPAFLAMLMLPLASVGLLQPSDGWPNLFLRIFGACAAAEGASGVALYLLAERRRREIEANLQQAEVGRQAAADAREGIDLEQGPLRMSDIEAVYVVEQTSTKTLVGPRIFLSAHAAGLFLDWFVEMRRQEDKNAEMGPEFVAPAPIQASFAWSRDKEDYRVAMVRLLDQEGRSFRAMDRSRVS